MVKGSGWVEEEDNNQSKQRIKCFPLVSTTKAARFGFTHQCLVSVLVVVTAARRHGRFGLLFFSDLIA